MKFLKFLPKSQIKLNKSPRGKSRGVLCAHAPGQPPRPPSAGIHAIAHQLPPCIPRTHKTQPLYFTHTAVAQEKRASSTAVAVLPPPRPLPPGTAQGAHPWARGARTPPRALEKSSKASSAFTVSATFITDFGTSLIILAACSIDRDRGEASKKTNPNISAPALTEILTAD